MRRTPFEARMDKFSELRRSEAAGEVADSMDVRVALVKRMHACRQHPKALIGICE